MSVKRYTAAGSGVMRTDPKGGYVNYSDYLELQNQPDALTAYLYAAELSKDDIKTLKAEVERLRKATEWQPIETAPKDGKTIIIIVEYGYVYTGIFDNDGYCQDLAGAGLDPTHWMPLPQPPKQEGKPSV